MRFMPTRAPGTTDEEYAARLAAQEEAEVRVSNRKKAPMQFALPVSPWRGESPRDEKETRRAFLTVNSDGTSAGTYIDG